MLKLNSSADEHKQEMIIQQRERFGRLCGKELIRVLLGVGMAIMLGQLCFAQAGDIMGGLARLGQERAVKKAESALFKRIGESVGAGAPIVLNQSNAFPSADAPANFQPLRLYPATLADLRQPLPPGDYSIEVTGYCTQHSMHAPGRGIPYKLARLGGRQSRAVGTLLLRLTAARAPRTDIQGLVWRVQGGVPVSQMSDRERALVHAFIPGDERALDVDVLQKIEDTYNKFRFLPNLPSLDSLLAQSEAGQIVLNLRRARRLLTDQTISAENLPERLFALTGDGRPWRLSDLDSPVPSPWSGILPGVIARFTVVQGFSGTNLLEFRIAKPTNPRRLSKANSPLGFGAFSFLPAASVSIAGADAISLADILGLSLEDAAAGLTETIIAANPYVLSAAAGGLLIAYSIGQNAQPLTILPNIYTRRPSESMISRASASDSGNAEGESGRNSEGHESGAEPPNDPERPSPDSTPIKPAQTDASKQGEILGWGNGQTQEAIDQTNKVTNNLTPERVQEMINDGLSKDYVRQTLEKYEANLAEGKLSTNKQAIPRYQLLRKVLELWPH